LTLKLVLSAAVKTMSQPFALATRTALPMIWRLGSTKLIRTGKLACGPPVTAFKVICVRKPKVPAACAPAASPNTQTAMRRMAHERRFA